MATNIFMETLLGTIYNLRMMGVPISVPSNIHGENMSVIYNNWRPDSTLRKKSNCICYHTACESVAMGQSLTGHVGTNENCAELSTKVLYS